MDFFLIYVHSKKLQICGDFYRKLLLNSTENAIKKKKYLNDLISCF